MRMSAAKIAALVAISAELFLPPQAAAHLVTTGMGPVYDGIGHLLLSPEDLVPVLALALFAGLRGAAAGRGALFLLPTAWFAGGLAGTVAGGVSQFPLPLLSFLVLGALVAADLRMPTPVVSLVTIAVGLVHGYLNGLALKTTPGILGLFGISVMLFVLVPLVSAFVVALKKSWTRVAVRVAGSWVFASGLLMIGWFIRGPN